jgi:hypothetical protein
MDRERTQFLSITPSRTRESSRARSLGSRVSDHQLRRAYTGQSFDDHAAYTRQLPASENLLDQALPGGLEFQESDPEKKQIADDTSSNHSFHSPIEKDIEKGPGLAAPAEKEEPKDLFLVTWDGPDDPANPKNWSKSESL